MEIHHIISAVRAKANMLKLNLQAIYPDLFGAHSLRSGGDMALKLHDYNDTTIMKMGRWTPLNLFQYIHNQIVHFLKDISQKLACLYHLSMWRQYNYKLPLIV